MSHDASIIWQVRCLFALNVAADVLAVIVLLLAGWKNEGWQFWLALSCCGVMQFRLTTGLWIRAFLKGGDG